MPSGGTVLPPGACCGLPMMPEAVATSRIDGSVGLTKILLMVRPVKTFPDVGMLPASL